MMGDENKKSELEEGWELADAAVSRNERVLEGRSYIIAAGALAISISIFSFAAGRKGGVIERRALWSCTVYAICIVADTLSYIISRHLFLSIRRKFEKQMSNGESCDIGKIRQILKRPNRITWIINYLVYIALFINIIYTISIINRLL